MLICVHTKLASVSLLVQTKHANVNQHSHKTAPISICIHTKHAIVGLLVQNKNTPMSTQHCAIVNLRPHETHQCWSPSTQTTSLSICVHTKSARVNLHPLWQNVLMSICVHAKCVNIDLCSVRRSEQMLIRFYRKCVSDDLLSMRHKLDFGVIMCVDIIIINQISLPSWIFVLGSFT